MNALTSLQIAALCAATLAGPVWSQSVSGDVKRAFDLFAEPCVTHITTGRVPEISGGFEKSGRKERYKLARETGRGWQAEMEFFVRRKQPECTLRVQGALLDQGTLNELSKQLANTLSRQPQATSVGAMTVRDRKRPAFRIGGGIYTLGLLSGSKNANTNVYVIFRQAAGS